MSIEALFPFARLNTTIVDETPGAADASVPLTSVTKDGPTASVEPAGDIEVPTAREKLEKDGYDLNAAVIFSRVDALRGLLDRGVRPTVVDADGYLPLSFAVIHQNQEVLRLLLAHGADPLKVDAGGLCPLELAEALGHDVVIDVLLAHLGVQARPEEENPL